MTVVWVGEFHFPGYTPPVTPLLILAFIVHNVDPVGFKRIYKLFEWLYICL